MSCIDVVQWITSYMLPMWRHRTHAARLSKQDRTKDDDVPEWKINLGTTGNSDSSGDGDKGNRPFKVSHDWHHNTLCERSPPFRPAAERWCQYVCNGCEVPTAIANRTPTSASREADTHKWSDMTVLTNKLKDPYRPPFFTGGTVPSLGGLARGIVMMVLGNNAKTRTATQDDFPPLSEELPWTSLRPTGSQPRKKKSLYMEETRPRQRSRSRS